MKVPPHHDPACWGCGNNPDGIHLPLPDAEQLERYAAVFSFDERHQGGPGIVHGGLVSAALDEACGLLATWHSFPAVTARLEVRYRRPAPINAELPIAAELISVRGRRLKVHATLRHGSNLLAEAECTLLHVDLEHFLQTPEGLASRENWERRLAAP